MNALRCLVAESGRDMQRLAGGVARAYTVGRYDLENGV
jgi:hypothetical protein